VAPARSSQGHGGHWWALVGKLASWYGVAIAPASTIYIFCCAVVNTTGNMDRGERDIYPCIWLWLPPNAGGLGTGVEGPRGHSGGSSPGGTPEGPTT